MEAERSEEDWGRVFRAEILVRARMYTRVDQRPW